MKENKVLASIEAPDFLKIRALGCLWAPQMTGTKGMKLRPLESIKNATWYALIALLVAVAILPLLKAMAPQHPDWKDKEPFASLL